MPVVSASPADFVRFLTDPGLNAAAGRVPLKRYLCLNPKNGGNAEINELLSALRAKPIRDTLSGQSIDEFVGLTEVTLLWKGQGHWRAFVDFMDFLTMNKDQFKGKPGVLGRVYEKYFAAGDDAAGLKKMVADHYFGIDCIGFVANYLRHVRLWGEYKGYEIDQWDRVFTQRVNTTDDVEHLCLMVWPGSHVAIVDTAWAGDVGPGKCKVDVCQSSTGGPQVNKGVVLTDTGTTTAKGYKLFTVSGDVPVAGNCYLHRWPDLRLARPD